MNKFFVNIICIQSDKSEDWKNIQKKYIKYLEKWVKLNIIELNSSKFYKLKKDKKEILKLEAELFKKYFEKTNDLNIILDINAKEYNTQEFQNYLAENSKKHINFFIGGPYGIDETLKTKADLLLSLSKLTFNHQLAKLVLLEQLYRISDLENSNKYHK